MDIRLNTNTLSSGNKQVRFEVLNGEYVGLYGYMLASPEYSMDKVSEMIFEHIHSFSFSYYPFSMTAFRKLESPIYITPQ